MDGTQTMADSALKGVGIGVYSPAEAQRLTRIPASSLRRWMQGTARNDRLWQSQHSTNFDGFLMGFRDLMEARVVHALRKAGFSLQELRGTMDYARVQIGDERPFSTSDFKTAGNDVFLDLPDGVLTVSRRNRGQTVFRETISPVLKSIEYGERNAERFWPQPRKRTIVLDPKIAFGKPVLAAFDIPTDAIARSVEAEGSEKAVAKYFDVPVSQIRDAVAFEQNLAA